MASVTTIANGDDPSSWDEDRILDTVPLEKLIAAVQRRICRLESKRDELEREVVRKQALIRSNHDRTGIEEVTWRNGDANRIKDEEELERPLRGDLGTAIWKAGPRNNLGRGPLRVQGDDRRFEGEEEEERRPSVTMSAAVAFFEDDDEDVVALDLFTNEIVEGGADEVIRRALEIHGFDLVAFVKSQLEEDPLAMARTVNFVRSQVALKTIPKEEIISKVRNNAENWQQDERYLVPVLGNCDPLLWWGDAFSEPDDGDLVDGPDDDDDDDEVEFEGFEEETDEVF